MAGKCLDEKLISEIKVSPVIHSVTGLAANVADSPSFAPAANAVAAFQNLESGPTNKKRAGHQLLVSPYFSRRNVTGTMSHR